MKSPSSIKRRIGLVFLVTLMILGFNSIPAYTMTLTTRTNAEVKFIVYPDGAVEVSSKGNYTTENPYVIGPTIGVDAQFGKVADRYNALLNATFELPQYQATTFPFNATTASVNAQYANNITTVTLDASLILCNTFSGIDFNSFPFNSTDLSIIGNYTNQRFNGTITAHLIPGLSLGDVHVSFEGNLTHVILSDSVRVYYNYTLPIPGFPEINATTIDTYLSMLNSTAGTGPGSLYEMTGGRLTCTTFNTTLTPLDANCADIGFLVIIEGDFIRIFADLFMNPYVGFPADPYQLINATVYSVKNVGFSVAYAKSTKTVVFHSTLSQNLTEYVNSSLEFLLGMYPPELRPYIELLYNTTYVSPYSSVESITYSNGKVTYNGNYTLSGDLNAQVNHFKNVYVDMINVTAPGPAWLINTLKGTNLDITNLKLSLNVNATFQEWNFEGVKLMPPVNRINATSFRLEDFFNITSSLPGGTHEPPTGNDTLKLIVQGGSNGTHSVTLHIDLTDPERVPEPDEIHSGNIMVWRNQSISKLKSLIFNVWEGKAEIIHDSASVTPNNPYVVDARQEANCILMINNISQQTTLQIKNVTAPDVPSPGTYKFLGTCIQISSSTSVTVNATIRVYYTLEQLSALGIDENSLKIFYFDESANQWIEVPTQVNKTEHYAEATISHFSLWALFGQALTPLWQEWWFLTAVGIIAILIIVAAVILLKKRKH
ncbi:MAG: hypothetical protein ACPL0C_05835 [Candidatus Bathyarchaeales archaeon]